VGRYYDPSTDQFLSVDPDVAETGQPYAFTGDDPLNATDPTGTKEVCGDLCGGGNTPTPQNPVGGVDGDMGAGAAVVGGGYGLVSTGSPSSPSPSPSGATSSNSGGISGDIFAMLQFVAGIFADETGAGEIEQNDAVDELFGDQSQISANRDAGLAYEAQLVEEDYPGADTHAYFRTPLGGRFVDILTPEDAAVEVKTGYTALTASIRQQVLKDAYLLQNDDVTSVTWVFGPSATTPFSGPSGPLAEFLQQNGINIADG
jgi:hypothetical protein